MSLTSIGFRDAQTRARGAHARRRWLALPLESIRKNRSNRMAVVEKSIEIEVPVQTAYNQWTQFEQFPHFMEGVERVRQIAPDRLHWVADIGGRVKEWDARIVEQKPDERIAWRSESGVANDGIVTFHPTGSGTRIDLAVEYEPDGFTEAIGDALGFMSRRVEGDLERFKEFIEQRGTETGSWRGQI
jgi:uncharacterized membrane protein